MKGAGIILKFISAVLILSISLVVLACGGGTASVEVEFGGEEEVATTEVAPTSAPEETATNVPEPTQDTQDTPEPAAPEPTSTTVPEPTATSVPEPTATPVPTCLLYTSPSPRD